MAGLELTGWRDKRGVLTALRMGWGDGDGVTTVTC